MITHLDSEKLTKILSAVCFAGAVLAGHTFAGDAAADSNANAAQSADSKREADRADVEIHGNPTVHSGMSGTNKAEMENRARGAEDDARSDADEPRIELTKELDIANPAKRTDSPNE